MNILFWIITIILCLFSFAMLWSLCEVASWADDFIEDHLINEREEKN